MSELRFGFGANWQDYARRHFGPDRLEISRAHLLDFLGRSDLAGVSVLDIGCGSGLHALAAASAGAAPVVGFDYDPLSVATSSAMAEGLGVPLTLSRGSILDQAFCQGLGPFDLVYSWGVLHHTGDQWRALDNAADRMAPDGCLCLALYNSDVYAAPEYWITVKRRYNLTSDLGRRLMEMAYIWHLYCGASLRGLMGLPKVIREYRQSRGMDFMTDVRDWLGGYPMEFSSVAQVIAWGRSRGLTLVKLAAGEPCAEYLFMKDGAAASRGLAPVSGVDLVAFSDAAHLTHLSQLPDRPYLIMGAAQGARLLAREALALGKAGLAGFLDPDQGGVLMGKPVYSLSALPDGLDRSMPVVLSNRWLVANSRRLAELGFHHVLNGLGLFRDLRAGVPGLR